MKRMFRWFTPAQSRSSGNEPVVERKSGTLSSVFALADPGMTSVGGNNFAGLARKGFMGNPVVHRCVRLIAENASAIPLLAYENARELDAHPVLALLDQPNSAQGKQEFLEALIGHLMVSGNAYVEKLAIDEEPGELHLLRPDRVEARTNRDGWLSAYVYNAGGQTRTVPVEPSGASNLLHIRMFHPLDDQYGFAPLLAAEDALAVHNAATRWNRSLLSNSARPSGALVYAPGENSNLSEDQFARLKQELEEGYTGANRAGRPLLLEGGLDWKAMGYSPRDMDFVEARSAAARDIALAFGVPPMLLGIPGDNTYSNYQEANRAFTRQTVLPLVNRLTGAFNRWFVDDFDGPVRLAIDEDRIEGLSAEREVVWSRLSAADFLTDAEKRQAVGYSPEPLTGHR